MKKPDLTLVTFPEQNALIAEDQPEYLPMPAYVSQCEQGTPITCCWQFSLRARLRLLFSGRLWHTILTCDSPLQPQMLSVVKPSMPRIRLARVVSESVFKNMVGQIMQPSMLPEATASPQDGGHYLKFKGIQNTPFFQEHELEFL